jgi:hypothetical protein
VLCYCRPYLPGQISTAISKPAVDVQDLAAAAPCCAHDCHQVHRGYHLPQLSLVCTVEPLFNPIRHELSFHFHSNPCPPLPAIAHPSSSRAEIGGLPLRELNHLELEFLFALDFDLALPSSEYSRCAAALLAAAAAAPSPSPPPPPPVHTSSAGPGHGATAGASEEPQPPQPPAAAAAATEPTDSAREPAEPAAAPCAFEAGGRTGPVGRCDGSASDGGAAEAEAEAPCGPSSPCPSAARD